MNPSRVRGIVDRPKAFGLTRAIETEHRRILDGDDRFEPCTVAGGGVTDGFGEGVRSHGVVLDKAIGAFCAGPVIAGLVDGVEGFGGERLRDHQQSLFKPRVGQRDRPVEVGGPVVDRFEPPVCGKQCGRGGLVWKVRVASSMCRLQRHKSTMTQKKPEKLETFLGFNGLD